MFGRHKLIEIALKKKLWDTPGEAIAVITEGIERVKKGVSGKGGSEILITQYSEFVGAFRPGQQKLLYSVPSVLIDTGELKPKRQTAQFFEYCKILSGESGTKNERILLLKEILQDSLAQLLKEISNIEPYKRGVLLAKLLEYSESLKVEDAQAGGQWEAIIPFILSEDADMVDGTIPLAPGKKIVQKRIPL